MIKVVPHIMYNLIAINPWKKESTARIANVVLVLLKTFLLLCR